MARTDKPAVAKVPPFVHRKLDSLVDALEAEGGSETSLVGAVITAATEASARRALRNYRVEEVKYRREQRQAASVDG